MPIAYIIDEQSSRILATAEGSTTNQDLIRYATELHTDANVEPSMTELCDLSVLRPGELRITSDGIRAMIEVEKQYPEVRLNRRIAMFSPRDLEFGMTRIYQNSEELEQEDLGVEIRVFRSKVEMEAWLDQHKG